MQISQTLQKRLRSAQNVVALTGAGISAESGVPTFRGENGIWKKMRPEELANFDAFMRNPKLVWEWYEYRRQLIHNVQPNAGHYALVEMERRYASFTLVTQNVDNLHQRAGNKHVVEMHGNIMRNKCMLCERYYTAVLDLNPEKGVPLCECGGYIRPDVVWFGELIPEQSLIDTNESLENCDLMFSIGTSGIVYPAASFPGIGKRNGAYVVEVNIERTILSSEMDEVLLGPSGKILPELLELMS